MALDIFQKAQALRDLENKARELGMEEMLLAERETGDPADDMPRVERVERLRDECRAMRNRILDTF